MQIQVSWLGVSGQFWVSRLIPASCSLVIWNNNRMSLGACFFLQSGPLALGWKSHSNSSSHLFSQWGSLRLKVVGSWAQRDEHPTILYRVIQNLGPPAGQNEKCSINTEDSIFKCNLFKNYLELFGFPAFTNDPFFGEIKKVHFFRIFTKE